MQSIPPEVYDRDYFLSEICEGWERFREDRGVSFNKAKQVEALGPRPGRRVLDAGCGRGEVLLACARRGAEVAGVDYSEDAVEITRETLRKFPQADIRLGDVTALPWPDGTFDRILFSDVIEHLDAPQTVPALRELRRVLRPDGFLLVHTAPNRLFMTIGWPLARPLLRALGHRAVIEQVEEWFKVGASYHVNEQSPRSLRRALRAAGFRRPRVWLDPDVLRSGQYRFTSALDGRAMGLARRAAGLPPFRLLLGNDLYALARKTSA
jgi:ubiquinone/menaquinone biosynthesis C-methylase UbiE